MAIENQRTKKGRRHAHFPDTFYQFVGGNTSFLFLSPPKESAICQDYPQKEERERRGLQRCVLFPLAALRTAGVNAHGRDSCLSWRAGGHFRYTLNPVIRDTFVNRASCKRGRTTYLQGTSFILFHRVVKLYLILDVGYLGGLLSHHITAFSSSSSVSLLESEFLGCPEENPPSISDSAGR